MRPLILFTVAFAACFNPKGSASGTSGSDGTNASDGTSQGPSTTAVMSTDEAGTTGATGTTSATSEPTTGGAVTSRGFRVDSLEFVDPHFFLGSPCTDVAPLLNQSVQDKISAGDYNTLLIFEEFDIDALEPALREAGSCDLLQNTCTVPPGVNLVVPASRIDAGDCSTLDAALLSQTNVGALHTPQPTCFRTLPAELSLPLNGATLPITLLAAQVVFSFDSLVEPKAITNGLIYGFFPRAAAEATSVSISMIEIDFWTLIKGDQDPDCAADHPDQLPSTEVYNGMEGAWIALNFTAQSIELE